MDGTQDLGPVYRLVYRSHATIEPGRREDALVEIFAVSYVRNIGAGVTGALLAWQDAFVQVLEGEESAVRALYDAIRNDPRHDHVATVDADTVPVRVFGSWSMARVGDGDGADIPLDMDRESGGVVSTGDPGQDTMLELMRQYARLDVEPSERRPSILDGAVERTGEG